MYLDLIKRGAVCHSALDLEYARSVQKYLQGQQRLYWVTRRCQYAACEMLLVRLKIRGTVRSEPPSNGRSIPALDRQS